MFQTFEAPQKNEDRTKRLDNLRQEMKSRGLDAFILPRADRFQGEYVAPCDDRLAWLTGFTGSAGLAIITHDMAGVFSDGRYTIQLREQLSAGFTPETLDFDQIRSWLIAVLEQKKTIGFDPWQNTVEQIERLQKPLLNHDILFAPCENLVDLIWTDRPAPPNGAAQSHPLKFAGLASVEKRKALGAQLKTQGHEAYFIGLPENVCWICNIRGQDVPRVPVLHSYGILYPDGGFDLFTDPQKVDKIKFDDALRVLPFEALENHIQNTLPSLSFSPVQTPQAILNWLEHSGKAHKRLEPLVAKAQAQKNTTEMQGARVAHERDALAMIKFLAWLDTAKTTGLSEIDVVRRLEATRQETGALRDISFDTIAGTGEHGAIVHYRVNEKTNKKIVKNSFLLIDSGGQYVEGTTDITRTIAIGTLTQQMKRAYTSVLKGMITLSMARFPVGTSGQQLDALARQALWQEGLDYGHGTGHGLGSYLSVHEGPVSISPRSSLGVGEGMILSNEPGFYAPGKFGIRIENIVLTRTLDALSSAFLEFETLTLVPIDKTPIKPEMLSEMEREWLNAYHRKIFDKFNTRLSQPERSWLQEATSPL